LRVCAASAVLERALATTAGIANAAPSKRRRLTVMAVLPARPSQLSWLRMDGHPDHRLQFVAAITYPRAVRYCGARPLAMKVTLPAFDCVNDGAPVGAGISTHSRPRARRR